MFVQIIVRVNKCETRIFFLFLPDELFHDYFQQLESPMVSVRLVTADSYQAKPLPQLDPSFSEFRGSEIKHVPVIRIFGTTADGNFIF